MLDPALRRRIVVKTVGVAMTVGLLFIFFGNVFMQVFRFPATAMSLAGRLILLIDAIKIILKEPEHGGIKATPPAARRNRLPVSR